MRSGHQVLCVIRELVVDHQSIGVGMLLSWAASARPNKVQGVKCTGLEQWNY